MFNLKEIEQKIMNYLTVKKPQLDRLQIKNNPEKLGRDIKMRMFYQNDLSPSVSEKPAFKVPSS